MRSTMVALRSSYRPPRRIPPLGNGVALRALGWTPSVSFDEGLERTIAWYRHHLDEIATPMEDSPA